MFKLGKLFKDYMELGNVQPLKLSRFQEKWRHSDRVGPVEWWYLGTGRYYHYIAERWDNDHRVAWKIEKEESTLSRVKHFRPKGGADRLVGVLLTEEIVGGM